MVLTYSKNYAALFLFFLAHIQIIAFAGFVYKTVIDGKNEFYNVWDFKKLLDNSPEKEIYYNYLNAYFGTLIFSVCFSCTAVISAFTGTGLWGKYKSNQSFQTVILLLFLNIIMDCLALGFYQANLIEFFDSSEFIARFIAYYFIIIGLFLSILLFVFYSYSIFFDRMTPLIPVETFLIPFIQTIFGMFMIWSPWVYRSDLQEYKTLVNLYSNSVGKQENGYLTILIVLSFALVSNVISISYKIITGSELSLINHGITISCAGVALMLYIFVLIFILTFSNAYDQSGHQFSFGFIILVLSTLVGILDVSNEIVSSLEKFNPSYLRPKSFTKGFHFFSKA